MLRSLLFLAIIALAPAASAQPLPPSLAVTVIDPSGGLIIGASVRVTPEGAATIDALTGDAGVARVTLPSAGRVSVRVESPGFKPSGLDLRVRRDTARTVKLALATVHETVEVGRDPRERASDPRSDLFATILGAAEIQELPDDPDDMERVLREMAGPGAVMRVNGFRGGRLPPKDQIAQIRFRRNMFAADSHEPGVISVDVITKPGFDAWNGSAAAAVRAGALNARNALAPDKGDEQHTRGAFATSGPLWKRRTSLAVSLDGTSAFDSQTLFGATLAGPFARAVRRPNDVVNGSVRVEHALTPARQLRVEFQRGRTSQGNLGVGSFELESRAFTQTQDDLTLRGSLTGNIGRGAYNEWRASWRDRTTASASDVQAPAVSVLNAFTAGGAQVDGVRHSGILEVSSDLDVARGRHAWRSGFLLETGRHHTDERRNGLGTFTFADLDAYAAGRATTFTRTVGPAAASLVQTQFGSYVQDDVRLTPQLTLSGGVRQEWQSGIGGLHLGPRGGLAWSPFRSGRTTVRAGAGLFFDWFEAEDALRVLQLDGAHQQVETVLSPQFPSVAEPTHEDQLSNGRVQLAAHLAQPLVREMSAAVEQTVGVVRLSAMGIHRRGSSGLRGIDVNAPVNGERPSSTTGSLTEVRSVARSGFDGLSLNLNIIKPDRRLFIAANYTVGRAWNEADSPLSVPADASHPEAERGPAATDARHRVMGFATAPLPGGLMAGLSVNARSALPYDVITGRDDNGDSLSTDRPAGTSRNAARGRATADLSVRLSWRQGFGGAPPASSGTPQIRVIRGGADSNPLADMPGGERSNRYRLEVYGQAFNALNRVNATVFGNVLSSRFFAQPIAAAPARRLELGVRLSF